MIVYIRNEELRETYLKYMRMITEIEEKNGITWKNEHLRWIYTKIVIQLEYIKEISNGQFDDEREKMEYEELIRQIEVIERESNIVRLTGDIKTQYINCLKVVIRINETNGLRFRSEVD